MSAAEMQREVNSQFIERKVSPAFDHEPSADEWGRARQKQINATVLAARMASASWEYVNGETSRLRVPGGWLYRCRRVTLGMQQPPDAVVFVPDL